MTHPLMCWDIFAEGAYRRQLLKDDIVAMNKICVENRWQPEVQLDNNLVWENKIIVITDDKLTIQHATQNMFHMNGYKVAEVKGRSPKMFQGEKTELAERKKIKIAVEQRQSFGAIVTNYKKDGRIYRCRIEAFPVFNTTGKLVNFIALENTVS